MGDQEARGAARTMLMIRADPITGFFHDAINADILALLAAVEQLQEPALIIPGIDKDLAKLLAPGVDPIRASAVGSLRRLKDRLPAVAEWYGPENEAHAQRVMSLHKALSYLLYWI